MAAGAALLQVADYCPRAEEPIKLRVVSDLLVKPVRVGDRLTEAIEVDIGPRLVLLHHDFRTPKPDRIPGALEIDAFARVSIGVDEGAVIAQFESARAQYRPFTTLLAFFLAPAAERLGELWRLDECDFVDVTVGVGRLQTLMDRAASEETSSTVDARRRAMLIALPGETHLFGMQMVAKFLESTGWSVIVERSRFVEETAEAAAREWIGIVGLTVSSASRLELAAATIAAIRRRSANRKVGIMVGGAAFAEDPALAARIGADAAGSDASSAALLAAHLLRRQSASA